MTVTDVVTAPIAIVAITSKNILIAYLLHLVHVEKLVLQLLDFEKIVLQLPDVDKICLQLLDVDKIGLQLRVLVRFPAPLILAMVLKPS